jgi:hypothetical protein
MYHLRTNVGWKYLVEFRGLVSPIGVSTSETQIGIDVIFGIGFKIETKIYIFLKNLNYNQSFGFVCVELELELELRFLELYFFKWLKLGTNW